MPYNPLESISHMIGHARAARELVSGSSRADLDTDRNFAMLVTHLMEIFGEASARIPGDFREKYPEFGWQDAANFRNVLIHQFDEIKYDILWGAVQDELPPLIRQLEAIMAQET